MGVAVPRHEVEEGDADQSLHISERRAARAAYEGGDVGEARAPVSLVLPVRHDAESLAGILLMEPHESPRPFFDTIKALKNKHGPPDFGDLRLRHREAEGFRKLEAGILVRDDTREAGLRMWLEGAPPSGRYQRPSRRRRGSLSWAPARERRAPFRGVSRGMRSASRIMPAKASSVISS